MGDHITSQERALIDNALRSGKVKVMPAFRKSTGDEFIWCPRAGQLVHKDPSKGSWRTAMKAGVARQANLKRHAETREKIADMLRDGKTTAEIVGSLSVASATVHRVAHCENITITGSLDEERNIRRAKVAALFKAGKSRIEIARTLEVHRNTVRRDLQMAGLM